MFDAESKSDDGSSSKEALLVGGCFALGALPASGLIVLWLKVNNSLLWLILTSVVSAFAAGALLWRKVFGRGRRPTLWRGAGVGFLIVIVAHPLAWYLLFLVLYFSGESVSVATRAVNPLNGLGASLTYSAMSLMVFGWVTVPLGGAIGGVLGYAAGKAPGSDGEVSRQTVR